MRDKYSVIYNFFFNVLGLTENEALKNALKFENSLSKSVLKKFKRFARHSENKIKIDPLYNNEFNKFRIKEIKDEKTK